MMNRERIAPAAKLAEAASDMWAKVIKATAHRNAFVSVMAPTGTFPPLWAAMMKALLPLSRITRW